MTMTIMMLPAPPADADAQTHPTPRGGEPERPYPNPPSTVHMAANGSLSLKMKISLEVDNESALPRFLEGRNIAILGWPFDNDTTTELREPNRHQQQIRDRLHHARQLCASLEEAADRAEAIPNDDSPHTSYAQAMSILQSSMSHIDQLVRLTKILDGNEGCLTNDTAIDTEIQKSESSENHPNDMQQQLRDQRMIRRQLRLFARERNPDLEFDEELERRHDSFVRKKNASGKKEVQINKEGSAVATSGKEEVQMDKEGNSIKASGKDKVQVKEGGNIKASGKIKLKMDKDGTSSKASEKTKVQIDKEGSSDKSVSATTNSESESDKMHAAKTADPDADTSDFATSFYNASGRESRKRLAKAASDDAGQDTLGSGETQKITHALLVQPQAKKARIQQRESNNNCTAPVTQKSHAPRVQPDAKNVRIQQKESNHSVTAPVNKKPAVLGKTPSDAPPPLPPRKCHECKNMCTVYRSCHYWNWTIKCIKKYCIPCLSTKHTLGSDVISDTNPDGIYLPDEIGTNPDYDREWHCPSCVAQRESEEERERIRNNDASRKSSRKSAMGNNYAGFF